MCALPRSRSRVMPPRRRWSPTLAILVALALHAPAAAHAQLGGVLGGVIGGILGGGPQIVYDPTAVGKLIAQMAVQQSQLNRMVQALEKLPNAPSRDIRAGMQALTTIMARGDALMYALRDADRVFRTTFPVSTPIADWPTEERARAERTVATMRAALGAVSAQAESFAAGLDQLTRMKQALGGVRGHEAAIELLNTASVFTGQELMLLRQAILTQANAQAVYYASEANASAQRDESIRALLAAADQPAPEHALISLRVIP
jgi:P-type conjugative transfer protein TrbJ